MTHVPWHEMVQIDDLSPADEPIDLLSIGIDIGTTTTHLRILSALAARPEDSKTGRLAVVRRKERYRSPIIMTPYEEMNCIDREALERFIERCYRTAGYDPSEIDTGAVIITGEAARAENADDIALRFSDRAGDFVCAMAGPNLEALISAHGSGAVDRSVETGVDILHLDIGGGTTEFSLVKQGFVKETGSIGIGARLVELDEDGLVTRLHDTAGVLIDQLEFEVEPGVTLTDGQRREVAELLAQQIVDVIEGRRTNEVETLLTTEFPELREFDAVTCSGGVSEFVYGRTVGFYNDLGAELGEALRRRLDAAGHTVEKSDTGIRATVSGSAQHSVQVSEGGTTITDEEIPPLNDVPMIPFVADTHDDIDDLTEQIVEQLQLYDVDSFRDPFAFGVHLHGVPTDDSIDSLVTAIVESWRWAGNVPPLIVVSDAEVGANLATVATDRIDMPVIAVDNVELDQFGYLDISGVREDTGTPLVSMKSLAF